MRKSVMLAFLVTTALLLPVGIAPLADEASDAAKAEEIMAWKEDQQEIARRTAERVKRAVLATDRAKAHIAECHAKNPRLKTLNPWYRCNFDYEPFKTAREELYKEFWPEEARRYRREREQ